MQGADGARVLWLSLFAGRRRNQVLFLFCHSYWGRCFRSQRITEKEEKEGPPMVSLNEVSSSRPCGSPLVVASSSFLDIFLINWLFQERENSPVVPSSETAQATQSQPITSRLVSFLNSLTHLPTNSLSPAATPPCPWSSGGVAPPSSMVPLLLPYPSLPHSVIYMSQVSYQKYWQPTLCIQ